MQFLLTKIAIVQLATNADYQLASILAYHLE